MAQYTYDDTFVVDSVSQDTLDKAESDSVEEMAKIGITDSFYLEKTVVFRTYVTLCAMQLENNGMKEKYDVYYKLYKNYLTMALHNSKNSKVFSVETGRG